MRIVHLFVCTLCLFYPLFVNAMECPVREGTDVVGEARSIKSGQLLYCEYYMKGLATQQTRVEYYNKENTLIALKEIDYSSGSFAPSVRQTDYRNGELRFAERLSDTDQYRLVYLPPDSDEEAIDEVIINARENLVIDAGFDKAIRGQWDELNRGEEASFYFAAPPNLRTFNVVVKQADNGGCLEQAYDSKTQACLVVKSSSTFLNWFIKPIALIYDRNTKRLLRFTGGVNVTSEQGKIQRAVINYHYLQ